MELLSYFAVKVKRYLDIRFDVQTETNSLIH